MQLEIRNFAKIKEARIEIDGITVIAGKNNTGKSTVGKVLDSVFNSVSNLEEKMENSKRNRLVNQLNFGIQQGLTQRLDGLSQYNISIKQLLECVSQLMKTEDKGEERTILKNFLVYNWPDIAENEAEVEVFAEKLSYDVNEIKMIPSENFVSGIVTSYFRTVFNGQINNVNNSDESAMVTVRVKGKEIDISFIKDTCKAIERQFVISNSSIYIDNPLILDQLNYFEMNRNINRSLSRQDRNLIQKLSGKEETVEETVLNEIIAREKLQEVMNLLNKVVAGNITYHQKYVYQTDNLNGELDIRSLSTGLKSFAVIKRLLQNGSLQMKDVIVLDEPEIHLHPEWQLLYAEIIVLLQKSYDFNIIVNTHSSHFLEALDFYSKKHEIRDKCHYYLANVENGGSTFEDVTREPEKIYRQLIDPSLLLDKQRYYWEEEHEQL